MIATLPIGPRNLIHRLGGPERPRFSLCTMVTRWEEYRSNAETFTKAGFDDSCAERLIVDNSGGNTADGYTAINEFLQAAQGDYIILCHQDVELLDLGREELEARLAEVTAVDPAWGICGNAGFDENGFYANCISHPHRALDVQGGPFPARVTSLDENFLVVRREANLAVSRDLHGFHHYGTDLCLVADLLGWHSYVIDFLLRHNSSGTIDDTYMQSRLAIARKYGHALRSRWVWVMAGHPFYVSGSPLRTVAVRVLRRIQVMLRLFPHARPMPRRGRKQQARIAETMNGDIGKR